MQGVCVCVGGGATWDLPVAAAWASERMPLLQSQVGGGGSGR